MEIVNKNRDQDTTSSYIDEHNRMIFWGSILLITIIGILLEIFVGNLLSKPASSLKEEDIYFVWLEGTRIIDHKNPYSYINNGNLLTNNKYAGYLPFFYLISALLQIMGFNTFNNWIYFFRFFSTVFYLAIAYLLFINIYKKSFLLAYFASFYWLLNRWTLIVMSIVHIDFAPLFFLMISLIYFDSHKNLSLLSFGLSLVMKHMAVFLFPMYLIMLYKDKSINEYGDYIISLLKLGFIPLILSLPFLIWDFNGFLKSIIFQGTRLPEDIYDEYANTVDKNNLIIISILLRLIMLVIMIIVYFIYWQGKIGKYTTSFLIFTIFIELNIILFDQYRVWRLPFLPLLFLDYNIFRDQDK